jgi:peroxiredoxin (alkyl hydroperoxide reductase subunit C)
LEEIHQLGAEAIGVGTSSVDSCVAWAQQIGVSFPIGGDFWPHGQVALQYGVLRAEGVSDRAVFLIDREGRIRFKEIYPFNQVPPIEPVMTALRQLAI